MTLPVELPTEEFAASMRVINIAKVDPDGAILSTTYMVSVENADRVALLLEVMAVSKEELLLSAADTMELAPEALARAVII